MTGYYKIAGIAIIMVGFLMSFGMALGIPPIIKGAITGGGLALDGSGQCTNSSTCFLTLTTSNANDVIIVAQASNNNGNCGVLAIPTATGLSFTARTRVNAPSGWNICEYYAIAPSALSSATITCSPNYAWGRSSCIAFGISGANTVSPFDLSTPCTNSGTSSTPSCPITTTNPNDFIIGLSTSTSITTATAGAGFLTIFDQSSDANGNSYAEYSISSVSLSGASVGLTYATSTSWGMIADAIKQGQSPTTTTSTTTTGSTVPSFLVSLRNAMTQSIVSGAMVSLGTFTLTSDGAGNANFIFPTPISPGPYPLTVSATGYQTYSATIQVDSTHTVTGFLVSLTPNSVTTTITITSSGTTTTSVITTTVTSTSSNPFTLPAAWIANPFNFAAGVILIPFGVIIYTKKNDGG